MSFITLVGDKVADIGKVLKKTYGPLDVLAMPSKTANTHRYPLDVGQTGLYPHTIEFQAWKPVPRGLDEVALNSVTRVVDSELADQTNQPADRPRVDNNQSKNSRLTDFSRNSERSDLFALYMPAMINERNINQYNTASMTDALGMAGLVLEAGGSISENGKNTSVAGMTPAITEVAGKLAQGSGLIGDAGVLKDAGLAALGYATNPQLEVLYTQTDLRSFSFEFKMTPRSKKEAEEIRLIIKRLKYHAAPEYIANMGRYIVPPSYFDIEFKMNGQVNDNLPLKISTCVLTSIDVDYAGGLEQFATHADGHPISITLLLGFTEMEVMHKALREEGY